MWRRRKLVGQAVVDGGLNGEFVERSPGRDDRAQVNDDVVLMQVFWSNRNRGKRATSLPQRETCRIAFTLRTDDQSVINQQSGVMQ